MPFLDDDERKRKLLKGELLPENAGDLNFLMYHMARSFVNRQGLSYDTINTVVGAYDCSKFQFTSDVMIPYEDTKREMNGDVTGYTTASVKQEAADFRVNPPE